MCDDIRRLLGRMRYHMLPKSKTLKGDSTEIVDVAAIDTRIFALSRGQSVKKISGGYF